MMHRSLPISIVLALAFVVGARAEEVPAAPYDVREVSLSQLAGDLAAGNTTAVEVTKAYIARIEAMDGELNSVIAIAPDAIKQAEASDSRRTAKRARGPMDGIPILLKDNIDAVGMPTTAGSYALENNFPKQDSEVAERLRASGAIILGKVNLSQFAGWRPINVLNGSTVGGTARNPYNLSLTPGGSSSGSGVAAAMSFAAGTVGSDTTGSIIGPGSLNGIVGLRPTVALISRRGIVPISLTMDTAGPMTRTVRDAAMMLTVLAGSDPADPASAEADRHKTDYAAGLSADALKGQRLGVVRDFGGYSDVTEPGFNAALEILAAQGAKLVEIPAGMLEDLSQEQLTIMSYDFSEDINAYLAGTPTSVPVRNLSDLMEFNRTDPRESPHDQGLLENAMSRTDGRQNPEYVQILEYAKRKAGPEGFDKVFSEYDVSALILPTRGPADELVPNGTKRDSPLFREKGASPPSGSGIAALAGYPMLTLPMGMVDGLPVGLSFIGPAWSEQLLLAMAYDYEQAAGARVPPPALEWATADSGEK